MFGWLQRIRVSLDSVEQKRALMDLDVSMRTSACPHTVQFYGALFREVSQCAFSCCVMTVLVDSTLD